MKPRPGICSGLEGSAYLDTEIDAVVTRRRARSRGQSAKVEARHRRQYIRPFQIKRYEVAEACIAACVHYVDLADGRGFVTGIPALDASAKSAGVWVISGASTVPGLSSAVLEHYRSEFATIDSLRYGISPGQKAERGLATTQGILSYVGKPLKAVPGDTKPPLRLAGHLSPNLSGAGCALDGQLRDLPISFAARPLRHQTNLSFPPAWRICRCI